MSLNMLAFFTGLFGSLHCVAMCGPLVMALPLSGRSAVFAFLQRLLYQLGRIFTYTLFGFLFGGIGKSFNILGWQQNISIATGLLLIILAVSHFSKKKIASLERVQLRLLNPLINSMGKLISNPYGSFMAGMLNGLLPCGMVYLAIAGAINSSSILSGGQFMFFFGLGTTPLMLAASLTGMFFRRFTRLRFSKLLPYLTVCMGIWFILRGAELNIPYLSPVIESAQPAICH